MLATKQLLPPLTRQEINLDLKTLSTSNSASKKYQALLTIDIQNKQQLYIQTHYGGSNNNNNNNNNVGVYQEWARERGGNGIVSFAY